MGLVKRSDLERKLEDIFAARKDSDPQRTAQQFLSDLRDYTGILLELGLQEYGFIHLTLQEYLAAEAIVKQGQSEIGPIIDILCEHVGEPIWHEVSLLVIGHLGLLQGRDEAASQVLEAILEKSPGKPGQATILAAEAVIDAWPNGVTPGCRDRVVEHLLNMVSSQSHDATPLQRVHAGGLLARLGDPRFGPDFYHLPQDPMLGFVQIKEGRFRMGAGNEEHGMNLPTYYIARYPVTISQYQVYLQSKSQSIQDKDLMWDSPTYPVRNVSWYEALDYCAWLTEVLKNSENTPPAISNLLQEGYQISLPTEPEWEKAARGQTRNRYPWGMIAEASKANYRETGIGGVCPVGCFPKGASPYQVEDLSGNVWEWTRSICRAYPYFLHSPEHQRREDMNASLEIPRILRGGTYFSDQSQISCTHRLDNKPGHKSPQISFRLVLSTIS